MRASKMVCGVMFMGSLFLACAADGVDATEETEGLVAPRRSQPGDAKILEWNAIAVDAVGAAAPYPSSRFMATTQVAVFEAVNAITGDYEPYLGTITAPPGASTEAAAIAAAHGVLKAFFPAQAATLDQKRADSLATLPDGQAKTDGIAVGEAAAAAMIANRTGDGSAPPEFFLPRTPTPARGRRRRAARPPGAWPSTGATSSRSASRARRSSAPILLLR